MVSRACSQEGVLFIRSSHLLVFVAGLFDCPRKVTANSFVSRILGLICSVLFGSASFQRSVEYLCA